MHIYMCTCAHVGRYVQHAYDAYVRGITYVVHVHVHGRKGGKITYVVHVHVHMHAHTHVEPHLGQQLAERVGDVGHQPWPDETEGAFQ